MISETGEQLGIQTLSYAEELAKSSDLDLVLITAGANPPVCKVMDYGKYRYEQIKRDKEAKKNQKVVELKEIQLSMVIQNNDMMIKAKKAREFLTEGNKLKVVLRMRGREQAFNAKGVEIVNNFFKLIEDVGAVDKSAETTGRNIIMIVSPKK